jgi:hypothetical protein
LKGKSYTGYRLHIAPAAAKYFYKEKMAQQPPVRNIASPNAFFHDGFIFTKVVKTNTIEYTGEVIDFEVTDGHDFCGVSFVLHNTPFEGSTIEFFKQHWYPMARSKYKDIALYGSEREAWAHGSWLPTPENLFGLKRLFQPYFLEQKHYWRRPYPVTGGMLADIPFVGSLSQSTVGIAAAAAMGIPPTVTVPTLLSRFIKPSVRMHPEYWTGGTIYDSTVPTSAEEAGWRLSPGFMAGATKGMLTGDPDWFASQPQVASAATMASVQRDYYDRSLGGMLGFSEFARRFVPRGRRIPQTNPLPNTLPNWLPGYRSAFEGDREGFIDFLKGDSYAKLALGEARLPGAGYEELNRLHSGVPNAYDPLDRFLVLSDVAPQSDAYKHYKDIVQTWNKAGLLNREWQDKYQEALYQVDMRFKPPFEEPRFSPTALQEKSVVIDDILAPTRFRAGGQMYQLAGIEPDVERQAWLARSQGKDANLMMRRYAQVKTKLAALEGKTVTIRTGAQGMESAAPAIVPGINSTALSLGLGKEITSATDAQAKFSGNIIERLWDKARHVQLPGPLNWPITKFFGRRSSVEEYQMKEIEGGGFAGWDSPYRNFVRFWGRQTENMFRSTPRIPAEVRRRRDVEEYFDNLKFLKNRKLEGRALAGSNPELASHYNKRWRKTMAGLSMDGANFYNDVWGAIPKTERRYFQSFAKESDPKIRKRILNMSPEYMKPIYLGIWGSGKPDSRGAVSMVGAQLVDAPGTQVAMRNTADFFKQFHLPNPDWAGWSPAIDLEQVRIKTVADTAQDFHDYQIWEGQVRDAEARGVPPAPFLAPVRDDASERFTWANLSSAQQLAKMRNEVKAHGRNRRRHSWT